MKAVATPPAKLWVLDGFLWLRADQNATLAPASVVAEAESVLERISLLVNNASVQVECTALESTDEDWDAVVGTNCRALFGACAPSSPR